MFKYYIYILMVILCACSRDAEFQAPGDTICMFGDSLTAGADWAFYTGNSHCINMGVRGDSSFDIKARTGDIIRLNPCKIFCMFGINDLRQGTEIDLIIRNADRAISDLQKHLPYTKIYLYSVLPVNPLSSILLQATPAKIKQLNRRLANLSVQKGVCYLDIYDYFADDQGVLLPELTTDGVHLTNEGYRLWASLIQDKVR